MEENLFSTYSTGENRVTATVLAVLGRLSLARMERLLGAMLQETEFGLVRLQNQPAEGGLGVPDAEISSSVRILVETKLVRGAVRTDQIKRHLERLDGSSAAVRRLLVLTPDDSSPATLASIKDDRVAWASFAGLDQAIDELLDDRREVVSEREAFLLRELQKLLVAEKLVQSETDVVVVPARVAWPVYQRWHAYICQPDRAFQSVKHIAFYSEGKIQPVVPKILEIYERVELQAGEHGGRLGGLAAGLLNDSQWRDKIAQANKVFLLSGPDDPATLKLNGPIENDLLSGAGRPVAFTQNQRYVSSKKLQVAKTTTDLI